MRRLAGAALVSVLLVLPSTASAGSYVVETCTPPGASAPSGPGAWTAAFTGDPADYDVNPTCAPGPSISPRADRQVPAFASRVLLGFSAPAGARIVTARLWHYGYATTDNGWQLVAQDDVGRAQPRDFFPEVCQPGGDPNSPCPFGDSAGKAGQPRDFANVDANRLEFAMGCARPNSTCPGGLAQAGLTVHASRVTVQEDTAPVPAGTGATLAGGWGTGADFSYGAVDPTGIRGVRLLVDGTPADSAAGACRIDTPKPCDDLAGRVPATPLPEGTHQLTFEATDGAGNVGTAAATARIDRTPPAVALVRGSGRRVTVDAPDALSGLAGGELAWAGRRGEYRPLATTRRGDELRARLPGRRPAGLRLRITATDTAGNAATWESAGALRASAGFGSRARRATYTGFGRAKTLTGRVRDRSGAAVADLPVVIVPTTLVRGAQAGAPVTVRTDASGRFRYRAPAGFSRRLLVRIPPRGDAAGLTVPAALLVRAASTLTVSPRSVRPGSRARLRGTLRRGGAPIPRGGKLLDLQAFDGGRWRTFDSVRTDGRGRWRASYRFSSAARGAFPLRARIRRESTYPFHVGTSRTVRVRVG